ncbi:MAG: anaerobic ribonucleoside-triphosphate reductase [Promethearchaeota archaeon]
MHPDKNKDLLGKQLKTLGQKIRIDILKKLTRSQDPLSFSKLQREVLEGDFTSTNFSFHLNELKKCELINSTENGYYITKLGKQILENILSIEQILQDKSKKKMIRTSKYSKERFDSSKIEDYLRIEGGLEQFLAKKISREVEERLAKTNIEYLTAPLMREYINAILLENGLEEVRHKLTRLGTPPYEAFKLFNSKELTPDQFIKKLGSDVSEQFLLLNLLPKKLADSYLSGEIALLNLNYWGLRPLSIYLKTETILDYITNYNSKISNQFAENKKSLNLILDLFDFLHQIKKFYSDDVILGDFNKDFLINYSSPEDNSYFMDLLTSQIYRYNAGFQDNQQHITLDIKSQDESTKVNPVINQVNNSFFNSLNKQHLNNKGPLLLMGFSNFAQINSEFKVLDNLVSNSFKNDIIFYNRSNNHSNLLNSSLIRISTPKCNKILLDKILINLPMISLEANQNDDLFFEILKDRIKSVFELFQFKENLVKKKLNATNGWERFVSQVFGETKEDIFKEAIRSISFFGLNKAILNHCGIELDRTESSLRFALEIFTIMRRMIEDQNKKDNTSYILTQPHNGRYLIDLWHNGVSNHKQNVKGYSSRIIRENSPLTLTKKIDIFKKFEVFVNGGSLFSQNFNGNKTDLKNQLKTLFNSNIAAISFSKK